VNWTILLQCSVILWFVSISGIVNSSIFAIVLSHFMICQHFAIVNSIIFATVLNHFMICQHFATGNSTICYSAKLFCDFISYFATVNSTILLQWTHPFWYSELNHFAKFLSNSWDFINHSLGVGAGAGGGSVGVAHGHVWNRAVHVRAWGWARLARSVGWTVGSRWWTPGLSLYIYIHMLYIT
jgi:hypothetical protein